MARSKGPCHSLSIKLGQAQNETNLMRKQLIQQQGEFEAKMKRALDSWGVEVQALKERACAPEQNLAALCDMVVAYDNLVLASRYNSNMPAPMATCLETLRKSLWEAAVGLGVKRV